MARFAVKTLEFDKVKNMLASKAATFLGKQAIISLQIESEFSKVKRLQEETAEALRILDEGRRFPFGGAFNITADVKRAELGSVLEPEELQHIQTTVQAFASMKDFTTENAETAPNLAEYGAELTQKKNELIANVIMGKLTYEQAMEQFESEGYAAQSQEIVDSLNALLNK